MHIATIDEAKLHLSRLIDQALAGDIVVIAENNRPLVRLTPISEDTDRDSRSIVSRSYRTTIHQLSIF